MYYCNREKNPAWTKLNLDLLQDNWAFKGRMEGVEQGLSWVREAKIYTNLEGCVGQWDTHLVG